MNYLLENANIVSPEARTRRGDIALQHGRIIAIGHELRTHRDYRGYSRINLCGATVIPGLVDAHVHLFNFALNLDRVLLHDCTSIQDCLRRIKKFADKRAQNAWVVGEGYAPVQFRERREPTASELDSVTGGRPAFIFAKDHHSAWVNSETLKRARITKHRADPQNSTIVRDASGNPTGILRETIAYETVFRLIPLPKLSDALGLFHQATQIALSKGVTGVHSFDSPEALPYLTKWAEQGEIPLRMAHYARHHALADLERAKIRRGTGTDYFWFAGIKMFADGTLGSRTADCFKSYTDDRGNFGLPTMTVHEMKAASRRAARLGFPVAIHAIGDRAVANALEVIASVRALPSDVRHRIEHLQLIRPSEIKQFRQLGVVASMQPTHLPSDIEMIRSRWRDRQAGAYRFAAMIRAGVRLACGSDVPIEPVDPLAGIATAIRHGLPAGRAFNAAEKLTARQALAAFTSGPAFALGREDQFGRIIPGFAADLTILERDPLECPVNRIPEIRVHATIVGGKPLYANGIQF